MYVMIQHTISDPAQHTFPTPDGTRAVCIWEAASVDAVRNEYFPVENREGSGRPSKLPQAAAAGSSA